MAKRAYNEPAHPTGVHDCLLYRNSTQKVALIQQSVELALRRGERCFLLLFKGEADKVMESLAISGVDAPAHAREGELILRSPEDFSRYATPRGLADSLAEELADTTATQRSTLIIIDGNIWFPSNHHEEELDEVATSETVRILCLYQLSSCIPETRIVHLMQSHRHTIFGEHSNVQSPVTPSEAGIEIDYLNEACALLLQDENEAIFLSHPDGRIFLLNDPAGALLGVTPEEARGQSMAVLFGTEADQIREKELQALESGEPLTFRLDACRDVKGCSWLVTVGGYRGSAADAPYNYCIIRNVTELKNTQRKLRFTAHLVNIIGQSVIATDRRGTIIFWNRAAEVLYGWKTVEVLGRNVADVTACRIWAQYGMEILAKLAEGQSWTGEFTVKRRDGSEFLAHVTESPIRDDDGRLIGMIGISFDITERKKAEEALAASEERFRRYFELGLIGMTVSSPEKKIIEVNDRACEILGYRREELLTLSWPELTHPEDREVAIVEYEKMLAGELDGFTAEKRYIRKDGEIIDAVISVSCLRRKDGTLDAFLALLQDVTERKRAERKIAAYQQRLSLMTEEMYRMGEEERKHLASVLHDQIGQNLALSKMKLESLKHWEHRDILRQEIAQITALLDEVIDKTRSLTTELRPPVLHELGLEAAVESLCEEFQEQTGLVVTYHDDGSHTSLPDHLRTLLFQGVRELLVNVMKHAHATGAEVSMKREEGVITISVQDDGIGMNGKRPRPKDSFGLFSLSERLRHLGGRVEISSPPGAGTCVAMVAPLGVSEKESQSGI
ncbi:PAS domain S-box protein [Geomonas sp. RF6]|uniref:PAS domain S-box protein n=1 Tax=Geomonas sp. RF6 TaxID=2897342 RepID=UPI001E441A9D|nr:PAS domain S-box protein [Geomonas sp. RF6]UFS69266.1 PAS domain S-box protein [Geomonas sp. RF6]